MAEAKELELLIDPYMNWAEGEGLPIYDVFGIDLLTADVKPWPRFDIKGAFVHLKGRGDFTTVFLMEIPPGGQTSPLRHLFDEVIYVLSGHGSTTVETHDGRKHSFEWGPKSLFAVPLNAKHQHFNISGREPVRFASTNNFPIMINLFHDDGFVFNCDHQFPDREGEANFFAGEGELYPGERGRNYWETNFVPDLSGFELRTWNERGAGSTNMKFMLADGNMHVHSSEMHVGTYKKGHRHPADFHIYTVHGSGYSLLWYEGDEDFVRVDWTHGSLFAPPDNMFHQHYNTAPEPARYLAIAMGNARYPFVAAKRKLVQGAVDTSVKDGGNQIEYEDQDPRIHEIWLKEIAKTGVESRMGDYLDETPYLKKTTA